MITTVQHPLIKLTLTLSAAVQLSMFAAWRFEGDFEQLVVGYFAPVAPFVAFVIDCASRQQLSGPSLWLVDTVVVLVSTLRAFVAIPLISGHSAFLSYALLRSRSTTTRVLCALVLPQVAYLKLIVWEDNTFCGGIFLGCGAAVIAKLISEKG